MNQQAMENIVAYLRKRYPTGCRVMLDRMDDQHAPPIGTLGTVQGVDDIGNIMVAWDSGSSLSVVYQEDTCHRIDEEKPNDQAVESIPHTGTVYQKLKAMEETERRNREREQEFANRQRHTT